jgi:hypothetical protein
MRNPLPFRWLPAALALVGLSSPLIHAAEIELIAVGRLSGTEHDRSGLSEELRPGVPHNLLGGFSALEYSGEGTKYLALPDRGPQDGAVSYQCRFQVIDLQLPQRSASGEVGEMRASLVETHLLQDRTGGPLIGLAAAEDRFDPEGLRVGRQGQIFISDEYGPSLFEFTTQGRQVKSLPIPPRFRIQRPSASKEAEASENSFGRQPNRGMEGLAITPDGKKLFGIMQGPLIQDNTVRSNKKHAGLHVRLLEIDLNSLKTRELVYQLENARHGVSEIVAISSHEFLLIERDGEQGSKAACKKIMRVGLGMTSDVSQVNQLPPDRLPADIQPVAKSEFLDLLDPRYGLAGEIFPEKVEGLTFGPTLPDGRRLLIVCVDNDFSERQPSWFYAFAIPADQLPDFGWPW